MSEEQIRYKEAEGRVFVRSKGNRFGVRFLFSVFVGKRVCESWLFWSLVGGTFLFLLFNGFSRGALPKGFRDYLV